MFAISVPVFVLMSVYGSTAPTSAPRSVENAAPGSQPPSTWPRSSARQTSGEKAPTDEAWLSPFGPLTTKAAKAAGLTTEQAKPYSLLYTYSLIIALVCGTAGLPHILVRFYTNPDGVAAKRTTMWVMILIGVFYVFPPVFGVLGRNLLPELYAGRGRRARTRSCSSCRASSTSATASGARS
jgi:cation/acetate symporter